MLGIYKLAHILEQQPDGFRPDFLQDVGFRSRRLEEAVASPEAETFRDLSRFVVSAGVRLAARYNPYTAAAFMLYSTYQIYETVDDWVQSQLPEWATDPLDLK